MVDVPASAVKALREKTGAGFMECKIALQEAGGVEEKAIEILRKRGLASAKKKESRATTEGVIGAYIHHGSKIGVLVEINCETDFVARNAEFQQFVKDIAMHICAADPRFLRKEDVPDAILAEEREIAREQAFQDPRMAGKPEHVIEKVVEGRLAKFFAETVLLEQPYIKDPTRTIGQLLAEMIAKVGENIRIHRFTRYKLGEDSAAPPTR